VRIVAGIGKHTTVHRVLRWRNYIAGVGIHLASPAGKTIQLDGTVMVVGFIFTMKRI
jgi:hypothetical protein